MHASLATYMYFKVVRHRTFDLGRFEWKFQATAIGLMGSSVVVFYFVKPYGCAGYW